MARVCISEPVGETRELLERLVGRLGHELLEEPSALDAQVLLFEPSSPRGVALARRVRRLAPDCALVAVSAVPADGTDLPGHVLRLAQPFTPAGLARVLTAALRETARATVVAAAPAVA